MTSFHPTSSLHDLEGILQLQKHNLPSNLSPEEIKSQGFVTVNHTLDQLTNLNNIEKHIIAKDKDTVIGYLLAVTKASMSAIPVLIPMFEAFNKTSFKGKLIADYHYIVIGQACVDKAYRGQGVFDQLYQTYKEHYSHRYDFAITEIDVTNLRSRNAHKRVGFEEVSTYTSPDDKEWVIVVWEWKG